MGRGAEGGGLGGDPSPASGGGGCRARPPLAGCVDAVPVHGDGAPGRHRDRPGTRTALAGRARAAQAGPRGLSASATTGGSTPRSAARTGGGRSRRTTRSETPGGHRRPGPRTPGRRRRQRLAADARLRRRNAGAIGGVELAKAAGRQWSPPSNSPGWQRRPGRSPPSALASEVAAPVGLVTRERRGSGAARRPSAGC